MSIGKKIKKLRQQKGWTQDHLADVTGLNGRQIGKYEIGQGEPGATNLKKLAEAFEVSVDYFLFDDVDDMATAKVQDRELLKRFELVDKALDEKSKMLLLELLDLFIRDSQIKQAYGQK